MDIFSLGYGATASKAYCKLASNYILRNFLKIIGLKLKIDKSKIIRKYLLDVILNSGIWEFWNNSEKVIPVNIYIVVPGIIPINVAKTYEIILIFTMPANILTIKNGAKGISLRNKR